MARAAMRLISASLSSNELFVEDISGWRSWRSRSVPKAAKHINGWRFDTETGIYGTDYVNRAFITAIGLGANRTQDAIYSTSLKDAEGKDYVGTNKYVMHFS
jgi:hypothetical protein